MKCIVHAVNATLLFFALGCKEKENAPIAKVPKTNNSYTLQPQNPILSVDTTQYGRLLWEQDTIKINSVGLKQSVVFHFSAHNPDSLPVNIQHVYCGSIFISIFDFDSVILPQRSGQLAVKIVPEYIEKNSTAELKVISQSKEPIKSLFVQLIQKP